MQSCFLQTPCVYIFKKASSRVVSHQYLTINPSPYVLKHCYLDIVQIPFSSTHHYTHMLQYKEKYKGKYISSSEHSNLSFPGQIIQSRQAFSVLFTFNFLLWIYGRFLCCYYRYVSMQ